MKKTLYFSFAIFSLFSASFVYANFPDVPQNSEYYQSISELKDLGIVQGYENGNFDMNRQVSRAEFLKMALLAREGFFPGVDNLDLELSCFPDVKASDWFAPYVCWAKENELVKGYPDGKFYPHQTVNVAEGAKLVTLIDYGEDAYYLNDDVYNPNNETADHWANRYFERLAPHGLPPSIHSADQLLNRAETAEMIWRQLIANRETLKEKPSRILVWNDDDFLNLEYLGSTQQDSFNYYYGKYNEKIYSLDGKHGYPFAPILIPEADVNEFKVEAYKNGPAVMHLGIDQNGVYDQGIKVPESVGGSFEFYKEPLHTLDYFYGVYRYMYGHDQENVYLIDCYQGCKISNKLDGADPNTFESLGDGYGKDSTHVYLIGDKIDGANADSFERLFESTTNKNDVCPSVLAKDENNIFVASVKVSNSDPNSFQYLGHSDLYFNDKNHVYRLVDKSWTCWPDEVLIIEQADPFTFEQFGPYYFGSKEKIYYVNADAIDSSVPLDGSDEGPTAWLVDGVDFESFQTFHELEDAFLSDVFAKDISHVYFKGKVLTNADSSSFTFDFDQYEWKDKNKTYSFEELREID